MAVVARFLYSNLVQSSAYTLTASSADQNHPVAWLRNHLLGKPWRSASGWTIYTDFNDDIDFNRGGVKLATITAGTYATSASMCAAVVAALEAADPTPVWACSYNSGTGVFTISSDYNFSLLCGTGANLATSAFVSLGFVNTGAGGVGVDTGSGLSQAGGFASYQSTHFIGLDLASSGNSPGTGGVFVAGSNVSASGAIKARRNNTSVVSAAASGTSIAMSWTADLAGAFFSLITTRRYWALVIEDCANADGYAEVPVWYLGTYGQTTYPYSQENPREGRELSSVAYGASGAHWHSERAEGGSWQFSFEDMPAADLTVLQALRDGARLGKAWFFATDATDNPLTRTYYGFRSSPMAEQPTGPATTTVSFTFEEILA